TSYANLERALVNVDGALVAPPESAPQELDESMVGVASHEGGHLRYSEGPGKKASALRQWLYNVVEDERVEVAVARRWPALSPPLAAARRMMLRADDAARSGFLFALFYLVRAPERMPAHLWSGYQRSLEKAMRILSPFPETPEEVVAALRR